MFVTSHRGRHRESTDSGAVAALICLPVGANPVLALIAFRCFLYAWMFFAYPLLVDRNLQAMAGAQTLAKRVANKWGVLGLMILNWLLSMVGALLCYIGLFLYLPIMFGSFAVAYRRIFPELAPPPGPEM